MQSLRSAFAACSCCVVLVVACVGSRADPVLVRGVPQGVPTHQVPPSHIEGSPVRGSVHVLAGWRETNDSLGRAGVHQQAWRIEGELAPADFPVGLELGISSASGSGDGDLTLTNSSLYDSFDSDTEELVLGPRLTWAGERAGLYLGAGSVWTKVAAESGSLGLLWAQKRRESGADHGLYAHFGAYGLVGPYSTILLEVRFAFDQHVQLFGDRDDIGYWEIDIGFGVRL